jgi:hypothetical protein
MISYAAKRLIVIAVYGAASVAAALVAFARRIH